MHLIYLVEIASSLEIGDLGRNLESYAVDLGYQEIWLSCFRWVKDEMSIQPGSGKVAFYLDFRKKVCENAHDSLGLIQGAHSSEVQMERCQFLWLFVRNHGGIDLDIYVIAIITFSRR